MSIAAQNPPQSNSTFAGTLIDILDRVEYRRVPSGQDIDPVYRLRYEAYRREDFIPFNSLGMLRDEFDDLPNAYCYGIYIDGKLVSSLRLHQMTREHKMSPSYSVFPDVLDPLLEEGHTFIDPGRFTADFEASLAYPALPFLTLRIAVMATWYFRVKYCLSTVRSEHVAFYRRVFNSTKFGDARFYHGLSFPMEMWACDCPIVYPKLMRRYPFFNSTPKEREQLFGPPHMSPLWIHTSARSAEEHVQV